MLKGFDSLKSIIKVGSTIVDNKVFALNYQVTALILLAFSIIVTSTQFIGDPIKCVSSKSGDALEKLLDTYCWIQSTYTLPSALNKTVGVQVPYPGVDRLPYQANVPESVIYHRYYQWVPFMLFLQAYWLFGNPFDLDGRWDVLRSLVTSPCMPLGHTDNNMRHHYFCWLSLLFQVYYNLAKLDTCVAIMFYVPRYTWKSFERNRIRNMIMDLNMPIAADQTEASRIALLAEYFADSMGTHLCYTFTFLFCEVLNMINVIGQIYFVDRFLGGEFSNYGAEVFRHTRMHQKDRIDPMVKVFPYMTKCMFYMFGPSGDVQKLDSLCLLPINVVNEKLYVFLWFWFVIVAIVNGLMVLYRIPLLLSKRCRAFELKISHRYVEPRSIMNYVTSGDIGDWFVLHLLGKNIDIMNFKVLVDQIDARLEKKPEQKKLISEESSL